MPRAKRASEISPDLLASLNEGKSAAATYVEMTAVDFAKLLGHVDESASPEILAKLAPGAGAGITTRMAAVGDWWAQSRGLRGLAELVAHPSDTVRGWACYLIAALGDISLQERLDLIQPLADDRHFGVREWAWIALRPHIAADLMGAIALFKPWTGKTANYRRFAAESTRPRGFWSKHIPLLKARPELGLPLLQPLRGDRARYVQLSVGNWLNDAFKSQPAWVLKLCKEWEEIGETDPLIFKRALRSRKDQGVQREFGI